MSINEWEDKHVTCIHNELALAMKKEWYAPTGHSVNKPSNCVHWGKWGTKATCCAILFIWNIKVGQIHGNGKPGNDCHLLEGRGNQESGHRFSSGLIKLNERETVTTPWTHQCHGAVCFPLVNFVFSESQLHFKIHTIKKNKNISRDIHKQASNNICYFHWGKNHWPNSLFDETKRSYL